MAFLIGINILCLFTAAVSDPLMRKDRQASVGLHLAPGGELIGLAPKQKAKEQTRLDTCNDDFPLGEINGNGCSPAGDAPAHNPIETREMCIQAAAEASEGVNQETFELISDHYREHPMGCFKHACSLAAYTVEHAAAQAAQTQPQPNNGAGSTNTNATAANNTNTDAATTAAPSSLLSKGLTIPAGDANGMCYFFNPVGDVTANAPLNGGSLTGTRVCFREKILNGTADTNGGCKSGFDVIYDETTCEQAAVCLGMRNGGQCTGEFRTDVLNNSQYDEFPHGCFINTRDNVTGAGDDCVYFNKKPINWPAMPARPKGINLCNVTNVTTAASVGTGGGATTGATTTDGATTDATTPAPEAGTDAATTPAPEAGTDAATTPAP